jgi:MFS-type transporter involved in bile tolerance (Atg22 family)
MNRADLNASPFMLTIGSFAIAVFAVLGCVFWACLNDRDQT